MGRMNFFHARRSLGMRPRLRIGMASPVEACSIKKVQHIIQNVAMLDMFCRQSMRHLFALELASVLDGTRIHSFGRAIVMSREWGMPVDRGIRPVACASQLYGVFYIDSPECYRSH